MRCERRAGESPRCRRNLEKHADANVRKPFANIGRRGARRGRNGGYKRCPDRVPRFRMPASAGELSQRRRPGP